MFDVTGRGDKSFNDAAAAGLDQAVAEFGERSSRPSRRPSRADDRAERVAAAAEAGNQLVIATGFLWTDTITQAAAAYPDTHFLLIDAVVEADNVHNIVFAEEQGSFLVGVAAALQSESGTARLRRRRAQRPDQEVRGRVHGRRRSASTPTPRCSSSTSPTTRQIGFNDPARGKEIGAAMYEAGADVVYAAAGASGTGVLEATAEAGEPGEVWTIGVDSDLYEQVDADLQPYVLTSMLKQRRPRRVQHDRVARSTASSPPGVETYDLSVDGVGYSTSGGFIDDYVPTIDGLAGADHRRHDRRADRARGVTASV